MQGAANFEEGGLYGQYAGLTINSHNAADEFFRKPV